MSNEPYQQEYPCQSPEGRCPLRPMCGFTCRWPSVIAAVQRLERERRDAQAGQGPTTEEKDAEYDRKHGEWTTLWAAFNHGVNWTWASAQRLPAVDMSMRPTSAAIGGDPQDGRPLPPWRSDDHWPADCDGCEPVLIDVGNGGGRSWRCTPKCVVPCRCGATRNMRDWDARGEMRRNEIQQRLGAAVPTPGPPAFVWPNEKEIVQEILRRCGDATDSAVMLQEFAHWLRERIEATARTAAVVEPDLRITHAIAVCDEWLVSLRFSRPDWVRDLWMKEIEQLRQDLAGQAHAEATQ